MVGEMWLFGGCVVSGLLRGYVATDVPPRSRRSVVRKEAWLRVRGSVWRKIFEGSVVVAGVSG